MIQKRVSDLTPHLTYTSESERIVEHNPKPSEIDNNAIESVEEQEYNARKLLFTDKYVYYKWRRKVGTPLEVNIRSDDSPDKIRFYHRFPTFTPTISNKIIKIKGNTPGVLFINKKMAHILGLSTNRLSYYESRKIGTFYYKDYIGLVFNEKNQRLAFDFKLDSQLFRPDYLTIYSSIVDHSYIGNRLGPVIRTVPVLNDSAIDSSTYRTYEFLNPEFHNITMSQPLTIDFAVCDVTGAPVKFINELEENEADTENKTRIPQMILTLLFSKVN